MPAITLTFDNGPDPVVTPTVLDCLRRHHASATFFLPGRKISTPAGQALARRALDEGHQLGSHTWSHQAPLGNLPRAAALDEFDRGADALAQLGVTQRLFRPIGGGVLGPHLLHPAVVERLQSGAYTCVLWNSVPGDWRDPHGWLERALADVATRDWSLLVLHDTPTGAMDHVEEFLTRLTAGGHHITPAFPPDCVPIRNGRIMLPLDAYTSAG